jgi:hypothetical protein
MQLYRTPHHTPPHHTHLGKVSSVTSGRVGFLTQAGGLGTVQYATASGSDVLPSRPPGMYCPVLFVEGCETSGYSCCVVLALPCLPCCCIAVGSAVGRDTVGETGEKCMRIWEEAESDV